MTQPASEAVIQSVRAEYGPRTLLSFSRGKDAIAAYIAIRDHFEDVIPYHLYLIPGLEFVDESLAYYERIMGRKIWNLPHPSFYGWLNAYLYQTPANASGIAAAKLPNFDYSLPVQMVCEAEGLPYKTAMVASGVRAADSPMRRIALMTHGAVSRSKHQYYPVWDWNKDRTLTAIADAKIALPVDYDLFNRSFDGLDYRFLAPLKKHRPADFRRILEWFPLAEIAVWRHENHGKIAA